MTLPLTLTLASLQDSNVDELTKSITNDEIKSLEVWWPWCHNPYPSRLKLEATPSLEYSGAGPQSMSILY